MTRHKHDDSDSAVLDRPTADEKAEAHRQEQHQKELKRQEAERQKRPSTKVLRYAADLIEQNTGRPRDVIENEVSMAVTNEAQGAVIRAILANMDGNIPDPIEQPEK